MHPHILYISKKLQRILDLFTENERVSFSKVMQVWKYINPIAAYTAVVNLMEDGKINVGFDKYTSEFVSMKQDK